MADATRQTRYLGLPDRLATRRRRPGRTGGPPMLGDHLVFPILLSKDLMASRTFYHDTLGLDILREDDERIIFRCGAGSQLTVTLSTTGTADTQTQLAWRLPDLRVELADLRARGVPIQEYDLPDPETEAGIAHLAFPRRPRLPL